MGLMIRTKNASLFANEQRNAVKLAKNKIPNRKFGIVARSSVGYNESPYLQPIRSWAQSLISSGSIWSIRNLVGGRKEKVFT